MSGTVGVGRGGGGGRGEEAELLISNTLRYVYIQSYVRLEKHPLTTFKTPIMKRGLYIVQPRRVGS